MFHPIGIFISTLFFPILIAGFLFFLINPVVKFLIKRKVPKALAILLIYTGLIGLIVLLGATAGPVLSTQIADLAKNIPTFIEDTVRIVDEAAGSKWFNYLIQQDFVQLDQIKDRLIEITTTLTKNLSSSISVVFSFITNLTLIAVTVPFILFYMLKDGQKFPHALVKFLPTSFRDDGLVIIRETSETLASYIQGQLTVSLFVGVASFIGFLIIDLPYAMTLGLVLAVTNIIPYLGPFIGAAPAVIVGLFHSPLLAILAIVVIVVVQQVDSNIISPLIIGKSLNIHPLTIIMILLVAGSLAGVLGMILAVPTYAVVKTITKNIVRLVKLYKSKNNVIVD